MKYIKLVSVIAIFSILITSCSKKSKLGKWIPKEAAVVVDINAKSLLSKLSWDEIKQTYWYSHLMADTSVPATAKTFLGDPAKTGIDMNSNIISFVLNKDNAHNVVEGTLKDSKLFADFLKSMHPNGTLSKDGELDVFKTDQAVIGWDKDRFVCVAITGSKFRDMGSMGDSLEDRIDSTYNATDSITTDPIPLPSPDSLLSVCKNIFSLTKENSLHDNERFADLENEEGDVHVWINISELTKGFRNMPGMMGMVKLDKFLEDNVSTITVNFQDGKISGTVKQYFGKELSAILKKGDGDVNTDMIKRLPTQNLAGIYAVHFSPANMLEIIKLTGLDGFINIAMAQAGISLDDVVKATRGDFVFSVSDVGVKDDTTNIKNGMDSASIYPQKPDATFLFAVAIGDKDVFNKLINLSKTMGKEMTDENTFTKSDDKYFAISNSQDAINKYFSGTQSSPDYLSKISDHPIGAFADLQMILKSLQAEFTKDSIGKVYYDRNIGFWNNVYFTGGEYKDGGIVTTGELNFVDKTTNSLKQLNKYVDDIVKIAVEKREKQKEEGKLDSVKVKKDSVVIKKKPQGKKRK